MIIISLEKESPNILWTTVETGGGFDEATVDEQQHKHGSKWEIDHGSRQFSHQSLLNTESSKRQTSQINSLIEWNVGVV